MLSKKKHKVTNVSRTWKYFFDKVDGTKFSARCRICDIILSYKSSVSNLFKHVKTQHSDVLREDMYQLSDTEAVENNVVEESNKNSGSEDETAAKTITEFLKSDEETETICLLCQEKFPDSDPTKLTEHMVNVHKITDTKIVEGSIQFDQDLPGSAAKRLKRQNSSVAWNYFTILDESLKTAECNYCHDIFSFRATSGNLLKHLRSKHSIVYEPKFKRTRRQSIASTTTEEEGGPDRAETDTKEQKDSPTISKTWDFYQVKDRRAKIAKCSLCGKEISYRSSTYNMEVHLESKHTVILTLANGSNNAGEEGVKQNITLTLSLKQLWSYYKYTDSTKREAECVFCRKKFHATNGFSLMKLHLMKKHQSEILLHEDSVSYDNNKRDPLFVQIGNSKVIDEKEDPPMEIEYLESDWNFDEIPAKTTRPNVQVKRKSNIKFNSTEKPKNDVKNNIAETLEYFSKYVTSLLQELPDKVSKKLQMDFIKQIIEAQIACDKKVMIDSGTSTAFVTVRKNLGAVKIDSDNIVNNIINNESDVTKDTLNVVEEGNTVEQRTVVVSEGTVTLSNGVKIGPVTIGNQEECFTEDC